MRVDTVKTSELHEPNTPLKNPSVKLSKLDYPSGQLSGQLKSETFSQNSEAMDTTPSPRHTRQRKVSTETHSLQIKLPDEDILETIDQPVRRPRCRWSEHKEQLLCSFWEKENLLYNAKHPDHRKTRLRAQAYDRIAALLEMDGNYKLLTPFYSLT